MRVSYNSIAALCLAGLAGCAAPQPINPSFNVSIDDARGTLRRLENHKVPLDRPLVIVGGYLDPGLGPAGLASTFGDLTGDRRIITVSLAATQTFPDCASRIVQAVDDEFPSSDRNYTTPVDVIGISMGGIAPRYAARHDPTSPTKQKRLNIVRLFTISTPHQGAVVAELRLVASRLQLDMRPGSQFIQQLNRPGDESEPMYPIYAYVRLNDQAVGVNNAAPPGQTPWWIGDLPGLPNHSMAYRDPRIVADIALRLRGQTPFATDPASPPPSSSTKSKVIATPMPKAISRLP